MTSTLIPSSEFRAELDKRGAGSAFRCYQCATCSSVCELAPAENPFPRQQMLYAQWGLADKIAADPAVWLCHQCNDCTLRCPRDAKPGDVMQVVRSLAVENLSTPKFLGKLVGKARVTWPLLIGLPFVFWIVFIYAVNNGLGIPEEMLKEIEATGTFGWHHIVPHWMIYVVYIPVTLWVVIAAFVSGSKFWKMIGEGANRQGSFIGNLIPAVMEILTHKRFGKCEAAKPRKVGHLLFMWGFIGAAITTGVIVIAMYGFNTPLPVPQTNWMKLIGNTSAILLVLGGAMLLMNRMGGGESAGATTAFDSFFLFVAVMVGATGAATELGRLFLSPSVAIAIYITHLSFILCLFATFPYSKFAHLIYRTLAMVNELMTNPSK